MDILSFFGVVAVAVASFAGFYALAGRLIGRTPGRTGSTVGLESRVTGAMGGSFEASDEPMAQAPVAQSTMMEVVDSITNIVGRFTWLPLVGNVLFTPENIKRVEQRLTWAGHPMEFHAEQWMSANIFAFLAATAFGLYGYVSGTTNVWVSSAIVVASLLAPTMWLGGKIKQRQRELDLALPSLIDKLVLATSGSDLTMVVALKLVATYTRGVLTDEIIRTLNAADYDHKQDHSQHFRDMAGRCGTPNVTAFCNTVINSITKAANVQDLLIEQQSTMRELRKANNQEVINKSGLKMMMSASMGIIAVLLVIAVPSIVSVIQGLSATSGN